MSSADEQAPHGALAAANRAFAQRYPGESGRRQPVHTVYVGAQLYRAETPQNFGALARESLARYGGDAVEFARAVGFTDDQALAHKVYERVQQKLAREPVEDLRIDFEDGFGAHPDAEEDRVAISAASELARAMREGLAPAFLGIRIKSLTEEWKARAARTLELFLATLLRESGGTLPEQFVVTLPKIGLAEQARGLVGCFERLERRFGLAPGALKLELMIELAQALIGSDGRSPLPGFLEACEGRCVGAHFGTYDFTTSCNVSAAYQAMDHPLCDLAKGMMMLAYAGTGIFLSDGATHLLPVGLAPEARSGHDAADRAAVHAAWRLSHRHIRHSLEGGFYQGWDLHPAQLPVRFASCYAFFLESFAQAAERLRGFVAKAAQATLQAGVFDDAATGQALLNHCLRAWSSGAIDASELACTGLSPDELAQRSFASILAGRSARR